MASMKICSTCKEEKSLELFCTAPRNRDERSILCKKCKNDYDKNRAAKMTPEQKQKKLESQRRYREANRGKVLEGKKKFYRENLISERKKRLDYSNNRRRTDPLHRVRLALSHRMRTMLKQGGVYKNNKTLEILGCDLKTFKTHIESLFQPGMNWNNYGCGPDKWHLDHKKPCVSFDLSKTKELRECFHYSNIQPLWETENLRKRDSLVWPR